MKKYLILCILFAGCMTAKNLPNHNDKFPLEAAQYAANKFPCTTGDTITIHTVDSAAYNQAVEELAGSLQWLSEQNDSLYYVIANYKEPNHTDTSCRKFAAIIKAQANKIAQLQRYINDMPPVFINEIKYVPTIDSAANTALRLGLAKANEGKQKAEAEVGEWKTRAKIRFWIIVALAAIIGARLAWGLKTLKF